MTPVQASDGAPVAIALLGARATVERATALFLDRYGSGNSYLAQHQADVERIIAGEVDHLIVMLGGVAADMSAAVDPDSRRYALLTIPCGGHDPADEPPRQQLDEQIDSSPAIVWMKDLDGRYTRVNRRYSEQLHVDAERVCGQTDAELSPAESMDGVRLRANDLASEEPLELEYTVPAVEGRPAFAVLRFAVRDDDGQPIASCAVAAPLTQAELARAEGERLMRIAAWSRLDESGIREALLDDWGLAPVRRTAEVVLQPSSVEGFSANGDGDQVAAIAAGHQAALASLARADQQLAEERRQVAALREDSLVAARRTRELLGSVAAEQARRAELERSLARAEARLAELDSERVAEVSRAEERTAEAVARERQTVETIRGELADAQGELDRVRRAAAEAPTIDELERERARADEAQVAANQACAEAEATAAALDAERRKVETLRAEVQAAEQADVEAQSALEKAREEVRRAHEDAAASSAALAGEQQKVAELSEEVRRAHEDAAASSAALAGEQQKVAELSEEVRRAHEDAAASSAALAGEQQKVAELSEELTAVRGELDRVQPVAVAAAGAPTPEQLEQERVRAERAGAGLEEERARAEQAVASAEQAEARAAALATQVDAERHTVEALRSELSATRQELDRLQAQVLRNAEDVAPAGDAAEAVEAAESASPSGAWDAASQRELSAALTGVSDWRAVLERAVKTLGPNGGWEAAGAWCPDSRRGSIECVAMWTRGDADLGTFETQAWQHRRDVLGAEFGAAWNRSEPTCLLELETAGDALLRAAASQGLRRALLMPIRDGVRTISMIELLSSSPAQADSELMLALDGIALQLGQISQLLNFAAKPHWHFGRL